MRRLPYLICLWLLFPAAAMTQSSADTMTGVVVGPDERAVAGANVFLLETLEGDLTGPDGRFAISVGGLGEATLVVLREGFREDRRALALPLLQPLTVRLERAPIPLAPIVAEAGHRSHVVNLDFVEAFEQYDAARLLVRMRGGETILASRNRSRELRELAF